VGVVENFPTFGDVNRTPHVYHPAGPGALYPALMTVRVRGADAHAFAGRLREVSAAVDPQLQLRRLATVEETLTREQQMMRLIGMTVVAVMLSVVALAAAGIYALMSFTVERRRREIGIRAALGANQRRLLGGIFSRVFAQLGAGAAIGLVGAVGLAQVLEGDMLSRDAALLLPLVALFMAAVGLLAALGPARRGLRIHPIEALRDE
jgi:predicted lysophospholipase L1 biosynthesis ABC-type transport system permease subunit